MSDTKLVTSKSAFGSGFDPANIVQVGTNGKGEPIVTYTNVYRGYESFHIRALWQQGEMWMPGKGLSLPMESAAETLEKALKSLAKATKPAKASRPQPQAQA
jgi:hypothetical protein